VQDEAGPEARDGIDVEAQDVGDLLIVVPSGRVIRIAQ
jgi:hypothetical protein